MNNTHIDDYVGKCYDLFKAIIDTHLLSGDDDSPNNLIEILKLDEKKNQIFALEKSVPKLVFFKPFILYAYSYKMKQDREMESMYLDIYDSTISCHSCKLCAHFDEASKSIKDFEVENGDEFDEQDFQKYFDAEQKHFDAEGCGYLSYFLSIDLSDCPGFELDEENNSRFKKNIENDIKEAQVLYDKFLNPLIANVKAKIEKFVDDNTQLCGTDLGLRLIEYLVSDIDI